MIDIGTARFRDGMFASGLYDLLLGRTPASDVTEQPFAPARTAAACALADSRVPPTDVPSAETTGNFRWLAGTVPDPAAAAVIAAWLRNNERWNAVSWRADVLAERLSHWLAQDGTISTVLDAAAFARWRLAVARGARHLARAPLPPESDWRRLAVHRGRLASLLALGGRQKAMSDALGALGRDVERQVLADGGHLSRAPQASLAALSLLSDIRDLLMRARIEPPEGLVSAIDRSVPFIKGMCHADGGFALMQGATAEYTELIEDVLAASLSRGKAMSAAPHAGFHRVRAGQTALILDTGATAGRAAGLPAAGALEISVGRTRLIGGCGARLGADGAQAAWQAALGRTAAQSTLIVDDKDGDIGADAVAERREQDGARLIEMTHRAYERAFGLQHRRTIYLAADGADIRGEDVLTGGRAKPFLIRFHLHPEVRASMVAGGGEVILKPPRGAGWRFHSPFPVMLDESVSFFDGRQHRAQQIVVLGNHEPRSTTIKWRLAMLSG